MTACKHEASDRDAQVVQSMLKRGFSASVMTYISEECGVCSACLRGVYRHAESQVRTGKTLTASDLVPMQGCKG